MLFVGQINGSLRRRVFEILSIPVDGDRLSRAIDVFLMALIVVNVVAVVVETVEGLSAEALAILRSLEIYSVIFFTIEYVLRLWTCTVDERYRRPVWGRLRYVVTFMALVDLFAVLPFYLPMLLPVDLRFLRALRLFRVFRLVKLGRYSGALRTLGNVIKGKKAELAMALFGMVILLVIGASLVYFAEHKVQPGEFGSIPAALWWGIASITGGAGMVGPVTALGKGVGSIIGLIRVAMFAVPSGILASGFVEESRKKRRNGVTNVCPHCGQEVSRGGAELAE
jgi:voltage-gated potassium channel